MIAELLAIFLRLPFEVIEREIDRFLHRLFRVLHGLHVVIFARDDDLADVEIFLNLQHAPDVDYVIEKFFLDLRQLRFEHLANVGRDFVIATGDDGCHLRAPRFSELEDLLAIR